MLTRRLEHRMVGAMVVLAIALAACSSGAAPTASPTTTPSQAAAVPTPFATPSASPTAEPSPTLPVLPDGGKFEPGTYETLFEPALTLTLDRYGESHVDSPAWVDVEYEGDPKVEIFINRLDQVVDPKHPGKLIDPPKDIAAWLMTLPELTAVAPIKSVKVGGIDALQLDIRTGKGVSFGPFGTPPNKQFRVVVLRVGGRLILLAMTNQVDDVEAPFDSSMDAGQPLVDSIVWH